MLGEPSGLKEGEIAKQKSHIRRKIDTIEMRKARQ
jgi:hypothetical protein